MTPTKAWEDQNGMSGVIGLGPRSPFWNYIISAYNRQAGQDYIEVSASYKVKDIKQAVDGAAIELADSRFTINGRSGINEPIVKRFDNNKYNEWVYEGA